MRCFWTYRGGLVLNTTITLAAGRLYFVETHGSAALADKTGRMPVKTLFAGGDQYLVGLDQRTGRTMFKKKIDVSHFEEPVYLNCGQGVLLLSGSRLCRQVDTVLLRCVRRRDRRRSSGMPITTASCRSTASTASTTGIPRSSATSSTPGPMRTCFARARGSRAGNSTVAATVAAASPPRPSASSGGAAIPGCTIWGRRVGRLRLNSVSRPGCWINMIPAGGMLLIPEASSGCTCGFPLQTSLAYIPESSLE